jgi:hypothetical protein
MAAVGNELETCESLLVCVLPMRLEGVHQLLRRVAFEIQVLHVRHEVHIQVLRHMHIRPSLVIALLSALECARLFLCAGLGI